LGGSRGSKAQIVRNTFIIFLVSGFWHGANWTFLAWGTYHALLFLPLILLQKNRKNTNNVAQGRIFPTLKEIIQMTSTFLLVVLGWVFFRAENIAKALDYLERIFTKSLVSIPFTQGNNSLFLSLFIMIAVEWFQRNKKYGLQIDLIKNAFVRWSVYFGVLLIIFFFGGKSDTFIYFQF